MSMRNYIGEAMQLIEDLVINEQIPDDGKKVLMRVLKLLSQAEDSLVEVRSQVRDITYTLQELVKSLGLEVKVSNPRISSNTQDVLDLLRKSDIADLEIDEEKAVVKKLVMPQQEA
ncbi:MAG: hypothetical protein QXU36_08965 [Thermofilum sp.]|uniref:hypothetical protein n=1 Tax=Thermofilum sp. TaxID=1961369 RepID=UPI003163E6F8